MDGNYRSYALPILKDQPCHTILMCNSKSANELKNFLQGVIAQIDKYGKPIQGIVSEFNSEHSIITTKWNNKEY